MLYINGWRYPFSKPNIWKPIALPLMFRDNAGVSLVNECYEKINNALVPLLIFYQWLLVPTEKHIFQNEPQIYGFLMWNGQVQSTRHCSAIKISGSLSLKHILEKMGWECKNIHLTAIAITWKEPQWEAER